MDRSKSIRIRVTPREHAALERHAQARGQTISELVRSLAVDTDPPSPALVVDTAPSVDTETVDTAPNVDTGLVASLGLKTAAEIQRERADRFK